MLLSCWFGVFFLKEMTSCLYRYEEAVSLMDLEVLMRQLWNDSTGPQSQTATVVYFFSCVT